MSNRNRNLTYIEIEIITKNAQKAIKCKINISKGVVVHIYLDADAVMHGGH
jgi:hypothetical protein